MAKQDVPKQISARLPTKVYEDLRLLSHELHRSQTKIIVDALVFYIGLARRNKKGARVGNGSVDQAAEA